MPHTKAAPNRMFLCIFLFAMASVFPTAIVSTQESVPVVDLTVPGLTRTDILGFPGSSTHVPKYSLPLVLSTPRILESGSQGLKFAITLRNIGNSTAYIPISQDHAIVLRSGNVDRRSFLLRMNLYDPKSSQVEKFTLISLSGSTSVPDSLYPLGAGRALQLIFIAKPRFPETLSGGNRQQAKFRMAASEWRLDNAAFTIAAMSNEIESVDTSSVPLR